MKAREEGIIISVARSLREGLREVLSSNLGKAGVAILLFMIVMSAYSLYVLPSDFPEKWKYPTRPPWVFNPRNAQPQWVELFGAKVADTAIFSNLRADREGIVLSPDALLRLAPEAERALGVGRPVFIGYAMVFRTSYTLDNAAYPQDVISLFKVETSEKVNKSRIGVVVLMYITRPDNIVLKTAEERLTLATLDYVKIDQGAFASPYISHFKLNISEDEMRTLYYIAVFGKPVGKDFEPLQGEYQITLLLLFTGIDPREVQSLVRNGDIRISAEVRVFGTSYGLLGTDNYGRDLFQGILFGFPVALAVGFLVSLAIVAIGLTLGVVSGYFGGRVDEIIQRTVDIIANIPLLPLLILVGVAIQTRGYVGWPALAVIMFILVIFSWGGVAIISRSMALSIKSEPYVEAAKALGASSARIVFRHILPQLIPYAMAALVFGVPGAILAEAGLSVLGIDHGLPTWGRILADAQANRGIAYHMWWWVLPPGILLGLFSFAFVALGFTLETIVEPRLRRR
ncbi:MAG: ABC transporter permease [Acidilobaceae archaeon]|nr:ABC transporter permease [Acidilobaceae archaeon]